MKGILILDPRVKLLLFFVTGCFVMSAPRILPVVFLSVFLAILLCLGGKWVFAAKSLGLMLIGTAAFVLLPGKLPGVLGALVLGAGVLLRMLIPIVMAFTLMFWTTTISQFMSAFQRMRLPVKVVVPVVIMFRFIPTVQEEWGGIRKAMAFRGISLHPGFLLLHPATAIERILIPLLFSAVSVMEELAAASLARGLDSDSKRTCLVQVRMGGWDYVCLLITLLYAGVWVYGYVRG